MKIVMVGAGNLATHFGRALLAGGNDVVQVYSRTDASASRLASILGCEAVADVADIVTDADLYVVAVTDSVLEKLLPSLCGGREHAMFVHTAGSMPMSVFAGYARRYGVIYPMQTFSKDKEVDFSKIPCFIEASDETSLRVISELCSSVSSVVSSVSSDDRKYLHLAAVFACNFTNHCYDVASRILAGRGIAFDVMYPLIGETVSKVHCMSPAKAQTGPAVRFDSNVMDGHLALLEGEPMWRDMYEIMSRGIHELKK